MKGPTKQTEIFLQEPTFQANVVKTLERKYKDSKRWKIVRPEKNPEIYDIWANFQRDGHGLLKKGYYPDAIYVSPNEHF